MQEKEEEETDDARRRKNSSPIREDAAGELSPNRMGYLSVVTREKETCGQICKWGMCVDVLFGSLLVSHCDEWQTVVVH